MSAVASNDFESAEAFYTNGSNGTAGEAVGTWAGCAEPTAEDPLRGLNHLPKVAVVGRDRILELASRPVVWIWDFIATAGLTVLLAAGPGCGKTTLLFLLIAARANTRNPVKVLGYTVAPAPTGKWIVIVENEHSDESTARMLIKGCDRLGVGYEALDRIIMVARGNVRIGSPVWQEVEMLIRAGLVSDVVLDTLARCAAADANDEQQQAEVFATIGSAIELAPSAETRPGFWVATHTRKCEGTPTLNDVSGSNQRAGGADVVILLGAQRTDGKINGVKAVFGKVREKDAEDWPEPVEYTVTKAGVTLVGATHGRPGGLQGRILDHIEKSGPTTKTALRELTGRSGTDIKEALDALIAATLLRLDGERYGVASVCDV